jgi:hypothetical protein
MKLVDNGTVETSIHKLEMLHNLSIEILADLSS